VPRGAPRRVAVGPAALGRRECGGRTREE
jgi:hypothetical protein